MKSKLLIATALFCGISVMAQEDVQIVRFTATSANNTSGDIVNLLVSSDFTTDFDNDYDKSKKMGSAESPTVINFYAYCAGWLEVSPKYASNVAEPRAEGLPFVFESNDFDEEYTITFSIKQGTPNWYFYDAQLDSATLIKDGGKYVFTQDKSKTDNERFRIYAPSVDSLVVCHEDDQLVIYSNPYTTNIVVKNEAGEVVLNKMPFATPQFISLESLPKGHYTVEFGGGEKKYIIAVKPEVETEVAPIVP